MSVATAQSTTETLTQKILDEGYGPGAWHGPDLKAALADVSSDLAYWRPGAGRHNIAEIALHHAYCARNVRAKVSGIEAEPFVVEGDDWFDVPDAKALAWSIVLEVVEREQSRLAAVAGDINSGRAQSPLPEADRVALVLGITCHAIYHAGQIQLIKKLADGR
jgi:hypothetical protein